MPLLRSQLQALLEGMIVSLGWALAPPERELLAAFPNTRPLSVVWRWVGIDTTPDPGKPGGPGQPMGKVMTWRLQYAAQVHSSVRGDLAYKYLAADVPDTLASALLDRKAVFWAGLRNLTEVGKNYVYGIEMGPDSMDPPSSINANGQVSGVLSFTLRAEIDARTDLELIAVEES
jgi:hypothetical protein